MESSEVSETSVSIDNEGAWSSLGLEEAVLVEFRFLKSQYDFAQTEADSTCVCYESDRVSVTIRLDRKSFELKVTVERKETGERFSVWEIARLQGAPDITATTMLQASTRDRVEKLVPELSRVLQLYGDNVLRGDFRTFLLLRQQQVDETNRFLREGRLQWIRGQIPELWQRRDYKKVVELLEEAGEQLSPSELAKLDYARRRLAE